jgi:hypothetical protein
MGSIALNAYNEIGLGYSISSSSLYPGIRYCGQSATAYATGAGVMDIAEATILTGTASQTTSNRWGDYTMLAVDPSDNRTFWYTNQYHVTTNPNHPTRIASFSFDPYCTASGGCDEYISRVQIGTIDNVSACTNYGNYTSISTNFPLNATKVLTVTNGYPYAADQCGVWIDWNKDNDFNDANETILVSGTPGVGPYTATITPPAGATTGNVRLRIRITYTGTVDPCGTTTYGEVEDYTLNLTAAATTNEWIGVTSTDWNTGTNWSLGTPPTSTLTTYINAGTPYQPVIASGTSAYVASLYMYSGSTLTQNSTSYFYCYGTFDAGFGTFTMNGTASYLYLRGASNSYWYDDYQDDTYTTVVVWKDNLDATVNMQSNMNCNRMVEVFSGTLSLNNTILTISSSLNPAFAVRNGAKIILDSSSDAINVTGSIQFDNGSQATLTNGTIRCGGNFTVNANTSYDIAFIGGTLIMNGSSTQYINDLDGGNLDLFNLTIAKTGGVCYLQSANLDVNGSVLISGGALSCTNGPSPTAVYNINVAGNWQNTVGAGGFIEHTGRVIFDGSNHQYCYGETFNILELNRPSMDFIIPNGTTTICQQLDWTNYNGELEVDGGTFIAYDLEENGLFGKYYLSSNGGLLELYQDASQYVDLNGRIVISNGTMNVYGGLGASYWPYSANAAIWMYGGVLDFKNPNGGIYIYNTASYTLDDNITGGIIRTAGGFSGNRSDFTPTAGTFEFYGSSDPYISQSNGCTLYNVNINKSSKELSGFTSGTSVIDERSGIILSGGGKANSATLNSDFSITNNLLVTAGSLNIAGYNCTVAQNANVYGILAMTNAAGVLNIGSYQYDNLRFYPGSTGNLSAGNIYLKSWIVVDAGSSFTASTNNTIHVIGNNIGGGLANSEPSALFGNVNISKTANPSYLASDYNGPYNIQGSFTVQPGNSFQTGWFSMYVSGNVTDASTSSIYLYYATKDDDAKSSPATLLSGESIPDNSLKSGSKGGSLTINTPFNLTGLLDVADGNVLIHGLFNVAASGTLTITSGTLLCDAPVTSVTYVAGNFNLGSGLYEIRFNGLNMYPATSSIGNGIIKSGGSFIANTADKFKPGFGTVELINGLSGNYIQMHSSNYFNHLVVNRTNPIGIYSGTSLTVKKDLTINAGGLNSNNLPIYLGGHWNENMGPSGFGEGTGTVYFNGTGALNNQFITGTETFYNLENVKPAGNGHLKFIGNITVSNNFLANNTNIVDGPTLDINNLLLATGVLGTTTGAPNIIVTNFTMGGNLSVVAGNFTCMDVTNNGIFGNITLTNGSITLFQDAGQWTDLNANVTINGGYMAINNGNGASAWGYSAPCSITMSGGELDFNNNGIYIGSIYAVTQNITGGTIKTDGMYYCDKSTFTPTGNTVEMYAGTDAYVAAANNSHIFNLLINKSGGVKDSGGKEDEKAFKLNETNQSVSSIDGLLSAYPGKRPVFPEITSKANEIYNGGVLKVMGTTTINAGTLRLIGYPVTSMGNFNINTGGKLQLTEASFLAIENGKTLTVNNGGILDMSGNSANPATITHNTGYYALNVESGGAIGAVYGVFEYMNTNGVNIKNGALVDVAKPFNNCTFRLGQSGGRLMSVENSQVFNVNDAIFPTNTWSGAYNVYKSVNAGTVNFVGATGGFSGENYDYDPFNRVNWMAPAMLYDFTVFMEGPFNPSTSQMKTDINTILPTSQPYYPALPYFGNPMPKWYYGGSETVGAIPNTFIVDWVIVQLREGTTPATATTVLATQAAFINNLGKVVGMDGLSPLTFAVSYTSNLYAVIWHRNHLGIISANPLVNVGGIFTYNFSSGSGQAYGGASAQKQLATGIWGMMSGDGDGSGGVNTQDRDLVWDIQAGTTGYKAADYNMNKQVNNPDKNDKWLPNMGKGSFVP